MGSGAGNWGKIPEKKGIRTNEWGGEGWRRLLFPGQRGSVQRPGVRTEQLESSSSRQGEVRQASGEVYRAGTAHQRPCDPSEGVGI